MDNNLKEIEQLKGQVKDLKEKVDRLYSTSTLPDQVINTFVKSGFWKYDKTLTFTNASGDDFYNVFVKFLDRGYSFQGNKEGSYVQFTVDTTNDTINSDNHGLSNGDQVWVYTTGTIPGGLSVGVLYTVAHSTTDTFQVTVSGSTVDITSRGTGYHYWIAG